MQGKDRSFSLVPDSSVLLLQSVPLNLFLPVGIPSRAILRDSGSIPFPGIAGVSSRHSLNGSAGVPSSGPGSILNTLLATTQEE